MARIKGLLQIRKNEYNRYLGLLRLKEMKDNNVPIPKAERKKLNVRVLLPQDQLFKRRERIFTMEYKHKYKRNLMERLQHENNKLGKRFDHKLKLPDELIEAAKAKATEKAKRRQARDELRETKKLKKQQEIIDLIDSQENAAKE